MGALADLRREIDEIDRAVHDLLMRRASVVEEIAAIKGETAAAETAPQIIYPAREAEVIRQLSRRHFGRLPLRTLVQIWREIISASVHMQRRMRVGLVESSADGVFGVARDHFGTLISMQPFDSAAVLFDAIVAEPDLVGVLPYPKAVDDDEPWWPHLASGEQNALRVVARLPFLKGAGDALVIGGFDPGASSADISLFIVESAGTFDHESANARALGQTTLGVAPNQRYITLVELDGGADAADCLRSAVGVDGLAIDVRYAGGYAVQLAG
tara:strand:- start:297 stop:1109 length:813 start_codon:yes stop_codon:yes gene_type:complete